MPRVITYNAVRIISIAIIPTPSANSGTAVATYQVGTFSGGIFTPGLNQGSGAVSVPYTNTNTIANILGAFNAGLQSQENLNFAGGDVVIGE